MTKTRRQCLGILLAAVLLPAFAENPADVLTAQTEVRRIHAQYMRDIAAASDQSESYLASFLPGGANAGKKLSEETELTAKQYRAVRRLIAQRNLAVREAYEALGLAIPADANISFL